MDLCFFSLSLPHKNSQTYLIYGETLGLNLQNPPRDTEMMDNVKYNTKTSISSPNSSLVPF